MACPTCDHTMQGVGNGAFWCPRCGTIQLAPNTFEMPMLVSRTREFTATLGPMWTALANRLGVLESIAPPHRKPDLGHLNDQCGGW
jgi:transposase